MESKSALQEKLLGIGGSNVVMPQNEYLENILKRGELFTKDDAEVVEYDDYGLCDYNSSKYYLENDDIKICTGYSYNEDSKVWTRHTWCIDGDKKVYECTPIVRDKYFGMVLNKEETENFISNWKFPEIEKRRSR